jgi:hypothetical protein
MSWIDRQSGVASNPDNGAALAALTGFLMENAGAKGAGKRGARPAPVLSRFTTLLAALAVFAQLVALPYHHPAARHDLAVVAAELKATFGPAAVLCTQSDDPSSPAPERRQGDCDPGCPLCQFAAHAALLGAPPPALPERLAIVDGPPPTHGDFLLPRASAIRFAQPRAPPLFA